MGIAGWISVGLGGWLLAAFWIARTFGGAAKDDPGSPLPRTGSAAAAWRAATFVIGLRPTASAMAGQGRAPADKVVPNSCSASIRGGCSRSRRSYAAMTASRPCAPCRAVSVDPQKPRRESGKRLGQHLGSREQGWVPRLPVALRDRPQLSAVATSWVRVECACWLLDEKQTRRKDMRLEEVVAINAGEP
jgi:hypothetical protein